MNHVSTASMSPRPRTLADRVRERVDTLGCCGVWARTSGPHVLLGREQTGAFARVTPLGTGAYGLAFGSASAWEPVLLIDTLADVVEHALVGEGALRADA